MVFMVLPLSLQGDDGNGGERVKQHDKALVVDELSTASGRWSFRGHLFHPWHTDSAFFRPTR